MRKSSENFDVCIIGAGIAGGTLAAYLGKQGLKVCVVEKSLVEQERIVGELLQPGGVMKLKEMSMEHLLEGFDAQPVYGYGLFMHGDSFQVSYSSTKDKEVVGYGFRNHKFISRIRAYLKTLPSVCLIEGTVNELVEENGRVEGIRYFTKVEKEEHTIYAGLTVVCDGMFSLFREGLAINEKKLSSYFMGLVLKDCKLPYPNHGHVIVAKPSPCLVYPISSTETRILIDFPQTEAPRKSMEMNEYLNNTILPQLPASIKPSFISAIEEGKFKVMPNHYFPAKPMLKPGAVLIGDSLNMRHPLTGGGMTAALTDIKLLGDLVKAVDKSKSNIQFDEIVKTFYQTRHKQNATINILADALYGVMRNEDLKVACYDYLKRGGVYAEEPVSLLSAVSRDQDLLLRHFFAVALYGIKNLPNIKRINRSRRMLHDAVDIVSPLVLNENPGLLTKYAFKVSRAIF
ncbi:MAG: FAD-dependent monooxygenase [Bacteroidota bacterium]